MLRLASAVLLAAGAHAATTITATRRLRQDIGSMPGTITSETEDFDMPTPAACTAVMAGCTGTFVNGAAHNVGGEVVVLDDCTFRVTSWTFDGTGPAVEWWAAPGEGDDEDFPYNGGVGSLKIGEIGSPGNYVAGSDAGGTGDITVRLGQDASGEQLLLTPDLNHISLWCEEFTVDFGNALLDCENRVAVPPAAASAAAPAPADAAAPAAVPGATAPPPLTDEEDTTATGGVEQDGETETTGNAGGAGAAAGSGPAESSGAPATPEDTPSGASQAVGAVAAVAAAALLAVAL